MFINETYQNNGLINVFFYRDDGKKNTIIANQNELLSSLFNRYIYSSGNNNTKLNFIYDGQKLNPDMTVSEAGIKDGGKITALEALRIIGRGGFCMNFTDLSKQKYEEFSINNIAPIYRKVNKGINIFGDCKNESCQAFNKEVIVPLPGETRLDLIKERDNIKCPLCRGLIVSKTVGFYLCKYFVKGKNIENNTIKAFNFYGDANSYYSFQYYNPIKNGNTLIMELIFEVIGFY